MEEIERSSNSAAAVFCNISKGVSFREPETHLMKDIIGVVALLGRVHNNRVSRSNILCASIPIKTLSCLYVIFSIFCFNLWFCRYIGYCQNTWVQIKCLLLSLDLSKLLLFWKSMNEMEKLIVAMLFMQKQPLLGNL